MIVVAVVAVLLVLAVVVSLRILGLRVVDSRPRRRTIRARTVRASTVQLKDTPESSALGTCVLRFGSELEQHVVVGDIHRRVGGNVVRSTLGGDLRPPGRSWLGVLTGYPPLAAHPLAKRIVEITLSGPDGSDLAAWYVPGSSDAWTIHVQGIRTSREVTLRSMECTVAAGRPTLSVSFRGAGEFSSRASRCMLGQREWRDLLSAVDYARVHGARTITVVGWSMGAGVALELARRVPGAIDSMILIAPATDWPRIVRHGASRAGLPRWVGAIVAALLSSRSGAALLGLPEPLDLKRLSWTAEGDLSVPTLVVHSRGDEEIPFALSERFAQVHGHLVDLVEFPAVPHAWEANADPKLFSEVVTRYLG